MDYKVKCTRCGTWNDLGDKYCKECGYEIEPVPESKIRKYKTKVLNKQTIVFLVVLFTFDLIGIGIEDSLIGNTYKIFMFINDQLVDPNSIYFKQAEIPLVIICVIQVAIFELMYYFLFYKKSQFREYYQFYVSIPIIHWLILFLVTVLLEFVNFKLFSVSTVLLIAGLQIGLMHLIFRGIDNQNGHFRENNSY